MTTTTQDDTYNIHLCLQGNANAFEPLVRRYQNAAFAVAMGFLRDRTDAEDAVQDAFVAAYCKLSQLKDPAIFGSWLHRIVVNRCKEWSRRKKASRLVRVDPNTEHIRDEYPVAARNHQDYIESLELWDEVERLPEHYRQVVNLYYYTGFSLKEIADFLDIPESTARGRLYQSRIRLKNALSPQEKETIAMSQIDVTEDVQDVVCKIAREDFKETIDMGDVENIVLYCGISTEVEIKPAKGNKLVIEGSKIALGTSEKAARSQLKEISVSRDVVEDFYTTGPHEGELFLGVRSDHDVPTAETRRISEYWKRDLTNEWALYEVSAGNRLIDVFPHLKEDIEVFPSLPESVRKSLGKSIRVSVQTQEVCPLDTKKSTMNGEIEGVFKAMWWQNENVFGPSEYCHISISVPKSKNVSVFRPSKISAEHVDASLMIYSCRNVSTLSHIGKDVYLFNCAFTKMQHIGGKLFHRMYDYGGGKWRDNVMDNIGLWEGEIDTVEGDVDIDVGRYELHASDLNGKVAIYNRYGTTHLKQTARQPESRFRLRTVSGDINLTLHEAIAPETSVSLHSLCGSFDYGNTRETIPLFNTQCSGHWLTMSSIIDFASADFVVSTESGKASIELFS
ncbi:MAG: sigma-70 family RNA polymerase sigma factor [Gemmatimonadetes bacterium]|nr:sigma-70 family RNA polymerase sigma factor [Gemmatimonadota bacterium]